MKAKDWDRERAKLKVQFERQGITRCESCNGSFALSFAHRYKRRFITTLEELRVCVLLCQSCHHKIEYSGHENMLNAVNALIEKRDDFTDNYS